MKVAIVGSRTLTQWDIEGCLPENVTEMVSGGAAGIDALARAYSGEHGIRLTEFLPDYPRYGKSAPLKRNLQIIEYSDLVIAVWDGKSKGTRFVIENCRKRHKEIRVYQP